jgi:glycosyltransferase involved in cell wall biosynthesis
MRIAHVTDFYLPRLGGIETHVAGLVDRQRRIGHQVDVVSVGGVVDSSASGREPLERSGGTLDSFHPARIAAASTHVLSGGYDVVHVHAGLATPLAFHAAGVASRAGIPTLVTLHSVIGHVGSVYRTLDTIALWRRWPVAWSAVSRMSADPLQQLLGDDRLVTVLHNAVDAADWIVEPLPRPAGEVRIAAVMRLARRKRPMQLLATLRRLRDTTPTDVGISAVIVGDGSMRAPMEHYLARHDMAQWVRLPGRKTHEQIRDTFRATDVFVAPAIRESFGIAALEARAAGLPVVAMDRAGIREFIDHGRDGLLVADDAGMTSALKLLATDPRTLASIAAHNRRAPAPFGWSDALAETTSAYERAAAAQRRPAPVGRSRVPIARLARASTRLYRDQPA